MDPIPLDDWYDLTRLSALALSPSGDRAAFVALEAAPEDDTTVSSLFLVPTDGSAAPRRLTRVEGGAGMPRFSPSGDRLAFVGTREPDVDRRVGETGASDDGDRTADDEPRSQVWLFDLNRGGDAEQVTDFEEGVEAFDWGPEGNRLVVAARDPTDEERASLEDRRDGGPIETERLQHKIDGVGYLDTVDRYLFVVDLETGERDRLDDAKGGGAFNDSGGTALGFGLKPRWGASGRIAFLAYHGERPDDTMAQDLYTIAADGSDRRRLTDGDKTVRGAAWDEPGDRLAFYWTDPEALDRPAVLSIATDGDDTEPLPVTDDLDRTVAWLRDAPVEWVDGSVYTLIGDRGLTRPIRVDVTTTLDGTDTSAGKPATEGAPERVFPAQGDRACQWFAASEATVVVGLSDPENGVDVHALDRTAFDRGGEPHTVEDGARCGGPRAATAELRRLSALNDDLIDRHSIPTARRVTFGSGSESDGVDVDGVVYAPPSFDAEDPEPHPTVVWIHGGPFSYDEPVFSFAFAALASRGYLVFRPNYRGSSSRGADFSAALRGQWGTVDVDDIVAGVDELVDRGWTDPDRVFGAGFSYGGTAQAHIAAQTEIFAAAAPEHGIYDLRSAFGTSDTHVWWTNDFGLPWERPEAYDAASSITDVDDIETPFLVLGGEEDWRCPPGQAEQLYVSVRKRDVPANLVLYPGENHAVTDPDRAVHRLEELVEWYERFDPDTE